MNPAVSPHRPGHAGYGAITSPSFTLRCSFLRPLVGSRASLTPRLGAPPKVGKRRFQYTKRSMEVSAQSVDGATRSWGWEFQPCAG